MSNDQKFYLTLAAITGSTIAIIVTVSLCYYSYQSKIYIDKGYQKVMVPGNVSPIWQKVSDK